MRVPLVLSRAAITAGFAAYKLSRRVREEPHRLFRFAQRVDPVHHTAMGPWIITSHAAVSAALRNPALDRLDVSERAAIRSALIRPDHGRTAPSVTEAPPRRDASPGESVVLTDPVLQPRLKALVAHAISPRRLAELRPAIEGFIDPILDGAAERGRLEVMGEVAEALPGHTICLLMGIPPSDEHILLDHEPDILLGLSASPMADVEDSEQASRVAVLREYVAALVAERRRSPGDDLVSALVGNDGAESESDEALVATVLTLLFAAQATTPSFIGNGVLTLLRHPLELARWHDDPSIEGTAVEELLRYDTSLTLTVHDVIDDSELEGRRIPRGSRLMLLYAAANHDAHVFKDPWKLDLTRSPNPHMSFGAGPHYCIGAPLARLQAGAFLTAFARRFPRARVAPGGVVRRSSLSVRGLQRLEILTR